MSVSDARNKLGNIKLQVAAMEALLKNADPKLLNFRSLESELNGLEAEKTKTEEEVTLEQAREFEQITRDLRIRLEAQKLEAKKEAFRKQNAEEIRNLLGVSHYDQKGLDSLDDLLSKDAAYSKANGIDGSSLKDEHLCGFAAKCQSENTTGKLSPQVQRLVDTKKVLVDEYAAIKFGERYSPEALDAIIQKDPALVKEAEEYYAKHNIHLFENGDMSVCDGDKCELRKFNSYTPDDLRRQLHVMAKENRDPKVQQELESYHKEHGIDPKTEKRVGNSLETKNLQNPEIPFAVNPEKKLTPPNPNDPLGKQVYEVMKQRKHDGYNNLFSLPEQTNAPIINEVKAVPATQLQKNLTNDEEAAKSNTSQDNGLKEMAQAPKAATEIPKVKTAEAAVAL